MIPKNAGCIMEATLSMDDYCSSIGILELQVMTYLQIPGSQHQEPRLTIFQAIFSGDIPLHSPYPLVNSHMTMENHNLEWEN